MTDCIIIGNGPSLKQVTNETLASLHSFGSNGILLRFNPTHYVAVNPLAIERFADLIRERSGVKYMPASCKGRFKNVIPLHSHGIPLFSYDPLRWVYEGHTVTFVSLQLAFMMGFETVYLLGVDHRYKFVGEPNQETVLAGPDMNHFDSRYFQDSAWHNPDLERSEHAYELAREAYENDGRRIINCTPDSALEVFEKGELP